MSLLRNFSYFFILVVSSVLLSSCMLTEKEFSDKNKASVQKYCEMKMLHLEDSKKKEVEMKQCVYFRTKNLYDEYVSDYKKRMRESSKRAHELELKKAPTNINVNTNQNYNINKNQNYNNNRNRSSNPSLDLLKEIREIRRY